MLVNETAVAFAVGSVAKTRPETATDLDIAPGVVCITFPE